MCKALRSHDRVFILIIIITISNDVRRRLAGHRLKGRILTILVGRIDE